MRKYAVMIAVLLCGCADVLMEKSSETVAATVKGKPLRHAVRVIGIPSEDKIVAGLRIVTWKVGNGVRSNYGCELRAVVDSAERISNYEIEGARGACYNWLHDLK